MWTIAWTTDLFCIFSPVDIRLRGLILVLPHNFNRGLTREEIGIPKTSIIPMTLIHI